MSDQTPPADQNPYGSVPSGGGDGPPPGAPPPSGGAPPPPPPGREVPAVPHRSAGWSTPGPAPGGYGQAGGYGAAPPPPPTGYQGGGGYEAPAAFAYGWKQFTKNAGPLVLGTLLVLVVGIVFSLLGQLIANTLFSSSGPTVVVNQSTGAVAVSGGRGFFAGLGANAIVSFIGQVAATLAGAALLRMGFDIVDGKQPSIGSAFQGWDKVQLVVASLLVSIATAIGIVLCILPGLVVAILCAFTTAFVVDRGLGAVEAIKASIDLVRNNIGATLLWILLAIVTALVGAILCGIGLLVAIPVIVVSQAYTVRALTGGPITAPPA